MDDCGIPAVVSFLGRRSAETVQGRGEQAARGDRYEAGPAGGNGWAHSENAHDELQGSSPKEYSTREKK
jgi:hypothetical protein